MSLDIQAVADSMYEMVKAGEGKKRYKPGDLTKAMLKEFEAEGIDKKQCKAAIKILIEDDKVVYTYFNGTWLEMPHEEGAAKGNG